MSESFVDLAYRGLSLGRRIKLTQVRPNSGYLEIAAAMPVGSEIAVAGDDGVAFTALVTWVNEQVAGSDRSAGMTIQPSLGTGTAAAWWRARVTLPEDDGARPLRTTRRDLAAPRNRPVTVRPRTPSYPAAGGTPTTPGAVADLHARVTAAAGVAPARTEEAGELRTTVMQAIDQQRLVQGELRTQVMNALDQEALVEAARRGDAEAVALAPAGTASAEATEGQEDESTAIMPAVDAAALGLETEADAGPPAPTPPEDDGGAAAPTGRKRRKR